MWQKRTCLSTAHMTRPIMEGVMYTWSHGCGDGTGIGGRSRRASRSCRNNNPAQQLESSQQREATSKV